MNTPLWTDSGQGDLLALVAIGPPTGTPEAEWDLYVAALHAVADSSGHISANRLRARVRGAIAPQRLGAFAHRAIARRLIVPDGWEVSDDREGKNAGRPARCYRLGADSVGGA